MTRSLVFGAVRLCPTCEGRGDVPYSADEAHTLRLQVAREDRRAKKLGTAKPPRPPRRKRCADCNGAGYVAT
jgi:DnaJ-class molecular chaperone